MKKSNAFWKLARAVEDSGLLAPSETLLVALSGGPDSIALASILALCVPKHGWKLHAVHVNHGLRGKASDGDEKFVRDWAQRHNIPLYVERVDAAALAKKRRSSIEEAARHARYKVFEHTAKKVRADKIVTAHTADDQAETLLWRLIRGSVSGLAGIPTSRPCPGTHAKIVRPFLGVFKKDILQYLKRHHIPYRIDHSNKDTQFTRNRIRRRLVPILQKHFNPSILQTLSQTAQALAHQQDWLDQTTQTILRRGILRDGKRGAKCIAVSPLNKLPQAIQGEVLKKAFESAGGDMAKLKSVHIRQWLDLAKKTPSHKRLSLGTIQIAREQGILSFAPKPPGQQVSMGIAGSPTRLSATEASADFQPCRPPLILWRTRNDRLMVNIPGATKIFGGTLRASVHSLHRPAAHVAPRAKAMALCQDKPFQDKTSSGARSVPTERLDWDTITPPLYLRTRRPGDRYQPLGLCGTKKIKDILMELKIPVSLRDHCPVLEDAAGKIVWLIPYRIADFCKIRPATRRILTLWLDLGGKEAPWQI